MTLVKMSSDKVLSDATLVLLSGNPLEDIRNTAKIEAVAIGGRWIDQAERRRMIQAAMRRLSGAVE